jgi:hypothetical protein
VPNVEGMTDDERNKLGLILEHESKNQNVMNYVGKGQGISPTQAKGYTAQGYYQILNSNWASIAPGLGIKAPNAMAATKEEQTKVALALLRNRKGIGNWANYNPALRAALQRGDKSRLADQVPSTGGKPAETSTDLTPGDDSLEGRKAGLEGVMGEMRGAGLETTSGYRDPHHRLSRANPRSAHTQARAFDVRARTAEQADVAMARIRAQMAKRGMVEGRDYKIIDEVRNPSGHASGPHVHTQMTPEGMTRYRQSMAGDKKTETAAAPTADAFKAEAERIAGQKDAGAPLTAPEPPSLSPPPPPGAPAPELTKASYDGGDGPQWSPQARRIMDEAKYWNDRASSPGMVGFRGGIYGAMERATNIVKKPDPGHEARNRARSAIKWMGENLTKTTGMTAHRPYTDLNPVPPEDENEQQPGGSAAPGTSDLRASADPDTRDVTVRYKVDKSDAYFARANMAAHVKREVRKVENDAYADTMAA